MMNDHVFRRMWYSNGLRSFGSCIEWHKRDVQLVGGIREEFTSALYHTGRCTHVDPPCYLPSAIRVPTKAASRYIPTVLYDAEWKKKPMIEPRFVSLRPVHSCD